MIKEKSAGAIIFYLQDDIPLFLLLKYKNYWGFVKGNVEKDESEEETVKRETKEEANLDKIDFIKGFKERIHYFYKFDGKLISKEVIFLVTQINKEDAEKVKISFEHQGFRWLSYEGALNLLKHKNEIEIFKKANEFLQEHLKQKRLI